MKSIIEGVTYNTETATRLGRRRRVGSKESEKFVETLYQTHGGAFFVVEKCTTMEWNKDEQEAEPWIRRSFIPMSAQDAQRWMLKGEVRVFQNPFEDPPEAAAEDEPGATIYIRVPPTLKRTADVAAREQKLSGNVWAMRCLERCLENRSLFDAWEIAPLIRKLVGGDKELAIRFQNARSFWELFFKRSSQLSVTALAKELGAKQPAFEAIFDDRAFAKEIMPLTCLGSLCDEQGRFKDKKLAKKVVEAFRKSLVSIEIKGSHLEAATRVYPLE